ncbi:hypothetical protein RchiOBHm_Chr3g0477811 [Rosa chinensis]|uniref:Uncharacterized protein n=1 Tax=Rosa chinensis TaxID=74649 RepID=A0A2P6RCZ7_ROSCH|nr:hypothetical protein RchiOBHm_Chr3g0477811 [Rosa chinensis]
MSSLNYSTHVNLLSVTAPFILPQPHTCKICQPFTLSFSLFAYLFLSLFLVGAKQQQQPLFFPFLLFHRDYHRWSKILNRLQVRQLLPKAG